jgi:hypothetical protein
MNHGNENNRFSLVCLMENGHSILKAQTNVLKLGLRLRLTRTDMISMTWFTKNTKNISILMKKLYFKHSKP